METVIKVENLSKLYRIGAKEGYRTFRETLVDAVKAPFQRLGAAVSKGLRAKNKTDSSLYAPSSMLYALKDVSFEVKQGEVVDSAQE